MTSRGLLAGLAALSFVAAVPAAAEPIGRAEKLRRLDIMLMVTGLRCRSGPDAFTSEYGRFTTRHLSSLNGASRELRAQLAVRGGNPDRALDRLSTTMANTYGQGHPWLNCAELKEVAASLAELRDRAALEDAADVLLADRGSAQLALARR